MNKTNKKAFTAAAVAGLMTMGLAGSAHAGSHAESDSGNENVKCYGINKCKGTGACGGAGHSCAGENECAGQGYLKLPKDTCLKIKGGRLTQGE